MPASSGPWCPARPTPSGHSSLVEVEGLDEHLHRLADPVLGPLRHELVDERGHLLDPGADDVLVDLAGSVAASVPSSSQ